MLPAIDNGQFSLTQLDLSRAFKCSHANAFRMLSRTGTMTALLEAPLEPMETFTALETPDTLLAQIFARIAREFPQIRAVVLGDRSGLPITSTFRGPSRLRTTATATLALGAATKVTESLGLPSPEDILIEAGPWTVLVSSVGDGFTLAAVVSSGAAASRLRTPMREFGREIRWTLDRII